jgi:hypothetical protein
MVFRRTARREIGLPLVFESGGRAEAVIRVIPGQELVRVRGIQVQPLGLPIRTVKTIHIGPFVPVETEPSKILEDAGLGLAG